MSTYRTGQHWGRTIIRVGTQPADAGGRRPDDQLVGVIDDPALAERICELLSGRRTFWPGATIHTRDRDGNDRTYAVDDDGAPREVT